MLRPRPIAGLRRAPTVAARAEAAKPAGFGKPKKAKAATQAPPKPKTGPGAFDVGSAEWKDGWRGLGTVEELFASGKATRAAEVNQNQLCIYKAGDRIFVR